MIEKQRVLILCTGNSCRSQMAEAWINERLGSTWQARSAGTHPADQVHPLAVRAMAEIGIDLSDALPEVVTTYLDDSWDLVVAVCDSAQESCPVFPRLVETLHLSFYDPAEAVGSDEEKLAVFRDVRDQIRDRLLPEVAKRG